MSDESYLNPINRGGLVEVSLAVEHLLIAEAGTSWAPTRVTMSNTNLPTGFRHLGSVVEDSTRLRVSRETYRLETGLPRVLQYQAVVGLAGQIVTVLHSMRPRKLQYALGNVRPVNTLDSTIITLSSTVVPTHTAVTLANSPGSPLFVGDEVVVHSNASTLVVSDIEARVSSISGATVYLTSPGFPDLPSTGWFFSKVFAVKQPFGTSRIRQFAVLGVADFIDGMQVVHHMQKAQVGAGDIEDAFSPGQEGRVQVTLDLLGYTVSGYEGSNHLVVAERYFFPKVNA